MKTDKQTAAKIKMNVKLKELQDFLLTYDSQCGIGSNFFVGEELMKRHSKALTIKIKSPITSACHTDTSFILAMHGMAMNNMKFNNARHAYYTMSKNERDTLAMIFHESPGRLIQEYRKLCFHKEEGVDMDLSYLVIFVNQLSVLDFINGNENYKKFKWQDSMKLKAVLEMKRVVNKYYELYEAGLVK